MSKPPDQARNDAPPQTVEDELAQARADLAEANRVLALVKKQADGLDAELQHRVRNILSVVRSIFSRTMESAESVEQAVDHFQGRLGALARYQLRSASSGGYDLEDMIVDTLMTYAVLDDARVTIAGPQVLLSGQTAETIGLALHELVTNAIKFGMLSGTNERATLAIRWETGDGMLSFEWNEAGIVILSAAPLRVGFGRDYIEQGLPYQLGGESTFELSAGRLRCTFTIPLKDQKNPSDQDRSFAAGVNHR